MLSSFRNYALGAAYSKSISYSPAPTVVNVNAGWCWRVGCECDVIEASKDPTADDGVKFDDEELSTKFDPLQGIRWAA